MQTKHPLIQKLLDHYKKISLLGKVAATLDWDLNVNLPPKAAKGRAEQAAYLSEEGVKLWKDTGFLKTVEQAQKEIDSGQVHDTRMGARMAVEEKAVIRNIEHGLLFYTKVPEKLIIQKTRLTSEGFLAWRQAREKSDFSIFQPFLEKIVDIDRQTTEYLGYKDNPYDSLLDLYNQGLTASFVTSVFDPLKSALKELLLAIQKSPMYSSTSSLVSGNTEYSLETQKNMVLEVMKRMGFDFDSGRMDVSPHPFTTTLDRYDIRITNTYNLHDFRESFTAGMHETGHALYEQGINPDYSETPLEGGICLGIHEALSRFWENMVGKNPAFLEYMLPTFQDKYEQQLSDTKNEELIRLFNLVTPSFIRIEADEVTYSLHIILRFEMENELINNKLSVKDAPEVWREKSKAVFGIAPEKDSEGILQDVHWAYGNFGYFPSYALGNLYGAQFLHTIKQDIPFEKHLSQGELLPIKDWLDKHVHTYGSLYYPNELVEKVTGESLNPKYFIEYLKDKYKNLYRV